MVINLACYCQNISFSKVIAPIENVFSASFTATGIVKQGNNYILSLIGFDTASVAHVNNLQSLYLAKVDSTGENFKILNKYVQADTNYYTNWGAFIKTHNNGFCYVCDIDVLPDTNYNPKTQHLIMLFDSSMNNTLTKIIPHDTIWEAVRQIKETSDHGFILTGSRQLSDYECDVPIIKTDSLGNQLWKTYISTGYYGNAVQIEETPDHGFLICGYRSSFTTGYGDPFIIKTDSAGNLKWLKILGNPNQLDGDAAIAITKDSNYIVALGYATATINNNQGWLARINVIKYSPDGTQIWNRMYDTIRYDYYVSKIQILPNNNFIVMGSNSIRDSLNFFATFLFKFDAIGDSLWRKTYYYTSEFGDHNLLFDNILNTDESITACGYVNGFSLSPYEQIWIMKTDSNGYSPACDYTGIGEQNMLLSKVEIKVYPNPATMQTTIAYPQLKEEGYIYIYNMLGQMVYEDKLAKGSMRTNLNIQNYKAGLYKVIIREKGIIKGENTLIKN